MLAFRPCLDISSIAPLERYVCAHGWQGGGGLYIIGTAMLINTNVYDNRAGTVCLPSELSLAFHPAPLWNLPRSRGSQGGGIYVAYNGVANFEGCNIHDNTADQVGLHILIFP